MPWGWPRATLRTPRSRRRGSTVSRGHCWRGAASASTAHACALAKARLEQVPSIHAYAGVPPGTLGCPPIVSGICHPARGHRPPGRSALLRPYPVGGQCIAPCSSYLCTLPAGQWAPYLARLDNTGSINAWSTAHGNAWIQVRGAPGLGMLLGTLQGWCTSRRTHRHSHQKLTPTFCLQVDLLHVKIIHGIKTQGARQKLSSLYVSQFVVFYSLDGQRWRQYKGNATSTQMVRRRVASQDGASWGGEG